VSAAPAWTAIGLLGVAIVLASGRLGGESREAPARVPAWQEMSSPPAHGASSRGADACPDAAPLPPKPANNGA
jgi:hypothetical protein